MLSIVLSPLVQCLALLFCDPQISDSNSVLDGQGYELFGESAYKSTVYFFL